jgi:NitT/TauT family transport system substrate-binding protein
MPVTLIENFRAVFYAPFYAAFALGAYEAEDVDVRLEMSASADKTLTGLLAGTGNVSWGGPMRLMHALDEHPQSGLVGFCEVVGRDPFYLLGREPNRDFRMNDLATKTLAVVSEVPTPWYCLQHDLRLAGIDPAAMRRTPARSMGENLEQLRTGKVDVIQVFEPLAQHAVEQGIGHIWHAAASRGPASYTTFNTTRSFLEREPETALRMTRAIYRTQKWIAARDGRELAEAIASYLPDINPKTLAACCKGYKQSGIWNTNPIQQRAGLEWLRDAMLACNAIRTKFSYEDLADMRFAQQVIDEDPPPI